MIKQRVPIGIAVPSVFEKLLFGISCLLLVGPTVGDGETVEFEGRVIDAVAVDGVDDGPVDDSAGSVDVL